jgi:hypothetical protein
MGIELEAAGDLITAGLVAREIEGKTGDASAHAHSTACANCGAQVTASYCGHCGQKGHLHNSVLHLVEELIHGLFHFETKGWRTLPLLVARPGELTRRYIDGQRTRFVSPLALFLFMMFLMFFVVSLTVGKVDHGTGTSVESGDKMRAKLEQKIAERKKSVEEAELELKASEPGSKDAVQAQAALDKAKKKLDATEMSLKALAAGAAAEADQQWDWKKELQSPKTSNTYSDIPWINNALRHAVDNPDLALYKLKNAAYKYSFLLVPISLPFLWVMFFWKRGVTMFHHAVFSLYSLSFMSLLFVALMALGSLHASAAIPWLASLAPPLHMAAQLRETYRLGRWGTVWRTLVLLVVSAVVFALFLLLIVYLTMG